MSRWIRLLPLLLLLSFAAPAAAQRSWPTDVSGVPAPPCTVYDPVGNTTAFCSATNPIPISGGGGAGTGTTQGTSNTGFGKAWYPSNFAPANAMNPIFDNASTVVGLRRGAGNALTIDTSTDGGVTFSSFTTTFNAGNEVGVFIKVPSATPRYLAYVANGASSHIFSSVNLVSGWADSTYGGTQLNNGVVAFASKTDGSLVLSAAGTAAAVEVCRSTNQGVTFGACITFGASNPGYIAYAGGTNWLVIDTAGRMFRSTNDGASFTQTATLSGGVGVSTNGLCASPTFTVCAFNFNGAISQSLDNGLTWAVTLNPAINTRMGLCDYGSGTIGTIEGAPPVGLSVITQSAWTSFNSAGSWYPGSVFGSTWNGANSPDIVNGNFACNSTGRGFTSIHLNVGGSFLFYNPLTQPGGVLTSSAGGYQVVAPIQSGIILNGAPTTSAVNTAATITLTGTTGSRICIREVVVFSSAAGTPTLVLQDNAVTFVNYGTLSTSTAPTRFAGTPLFCGNTGDNVQVVVGAAGAAVTTTTSVIADRYPN